MINRKRNGSNDVGWGILPGNYSRFLTQLDPGSGDVGFWNIDESIYGRFARGFEHKSGKTQMRFELDEAFQADTIEVNVTYLDRGRGAWSLGVLGSPEKELFRNSDSGQWKTVKITMPRRAPAGCATVAELRRRGRHGLSPDRDRTNLIIRRFRGPQNPLADKEGSKQ